MVHQKIFFYLIAMNIWKGKKMKIEKVRNNPDDVWKKEIPFEKGDVIHSKNHGFWFWVKIRNGLVFRIYKNEMSFHSRSVKRELIRPGEHFYKVK